MTGQEYVDGVANTLRGCSPPFHSGDEEARSGPGVWSTIVAMRWWRAARMMGSSLLAGPGGGIPGVFQQRGWTCQEYCCYTLPPSNFSWCGDAQWQEIKPHPRRSGSFVMCWAASHTMLYVGDSEVDWQTAKAPRCP